MGPDGQKPIFGPPYFKVGKNSTFWNDQYHIYSLCTFQLHIKTVHRGSSFDFKGPQTLKVVLYCHFIDETPWICERALQKTKRTIVLKLSGFSYLINTNFLWKQEKIWRGCAAQVCGVDMEWPSSSSVALSLLTWLTFGLNQSTCKHHILKSSIGHICWL